MLKKIEIMLNIFKKSIMLVAIMAMSFGVYAENNPAPPTSALASITVTITDKGANCPTTGEFKSVWSWRHPIYPNPIGQLDGTSENYPQVPWTVKLDAIHPGPPWELIPVNVKVTVEPWGHPEARNSAIVFPPFSPITLNPLDCYPPNTNPPHSKD